MALIARYKKPSGTCSLATRSVQLTMARVILICICLLFAGGHLAAASKSFGGGGGYGGEGSAAAQEVQTAAQEAVEGAEQVASESASLTTPTTREEQPAAEAAASTAGGSQQEGYGSTQLPSDEPLNGLNDKAIQDILNEHNMFRAKEHVPPLMWNTTLAKFSQDYAESKLKKDCKMVHSDSPYGENLMFGSGAISWKTTVDTWSDEKKSYHYGSNTCDQGKMCGHYTAVVWKDTTSVGCGRVLCDDKKDTMIMCSYWPPGNYDNQKPY